MTKCRILFFWLLVGSKLLLVGGIPNFGSLHDSDQYSFRHPRPVGSSHLSSWRPSRRDSLVFIPHNRHFCDHAWWAFLWLRRGLFLSPVIRPNLTLLLSLLVAHVMVVAPKRESEDDPRGFFESKLLELGARVLGYVWIGQGIGGAASMLRMSPVCFDGTLVPTFFVLTFPLLAFSAWRRSLGRDGTYDSLGRHVWILCGTQVGENQGCAWFKVCFLPLRHLLHRRLTCFAWFYSPNKTLEGLIGHILLAPSGLLVAILLSPVLGDWTSAWMPSRTREHTIWLLLFGWTIGAVGAIGDLVESVSFLVGVPVLLVSLTKLSPISIVYQTCGRRQGQWRLVPWTRRAFG